MISPTGITGLGCALFPLPWAHLLHSAYDHLLHPLLTAPVTAAMVACGTTMLLATSRHGRSVPPPSLVFRAARSWPSRCRWSARVAAAAGVCWHVAHSSCHRHDPRPAAGASPPCVCSAS